MKKVDKKEFSKDELKRHTGSLSEKYQNDIKIIREGITHLLQASKRQEKTLNSHSEQIASLLVNTTVVKSDIKELRAGMLEVKSDIKQIKFDVKMDLDRKIDKKHFVGLEGRVRVLEKK